MRKETIFGKKKRKMESFLKGTQRNGPLSEKEDTKRAKGLDNIAREHRTRQGLDNNYNRRV